MGRPPLGTRWGDLSPEQRAALPVGTVLRACPPFDDELSDRVKALDGRWYERGDSTGKDDRNIWDERLVHFLPDHRDCDGPGSDEGGGEPKGGDNDPGRGPAWRCSCGYGYPLGHPRCPKCCRYPARDCEGAEDAPRDCLP